MRPAAAAGHPAALPVHGAGYGGLHLFLHHHFFGSWEVAVAESEKVLAGFLLGLPHTSD